MIGHILWEIFNWPAGIIVGNLLASVIWSSVFEWRLRKHHKKVHESFREHVKELRDHAGHQGS